VVSLGIEQSIERVQGWTSSTKALDENDAFTAAVNRGATPNQACSARTVSGPPQKSTKEIRNWKLTMNYLQPSEYETYGLETTTAPAWVIAASAIVDAHCRRATLSVAQYTERLLITTGRNTVRLTYLPLAVVAPGIAEALFATAIGLIAAIPATIFYNKFTSEVNRQAQRLEGFADEFSAILSRQIDERA